MIERVRSATPAPVVNSLRAMTLSYGQATASIRPMPDFLVIGAKKGGTTSVVNWLSRHPHVLPMFPRLQRRKSPHYFDINYWRGDTWYRAHFPSLLMRGLHHRRTGVPPLTGEASPYYLFHPWAAERIKRTVPDVRLIAVLREPVSRAYSNFMDRRSTGNEPLDSFEAAIDAESLRLSNVTDAWLHQANAYSFEHDHHTYLHRGHYATQLRRYFEAFDGSQILVLTLDELARDTPAAFAKVQDFLGLPRAEVDLRPVNVRSGVPPISEATWNRLQRYYAPLNADLYELLGLDLGW